MKYPPRLRLAHLPTPLEPMLRLNKDLGGARIFLKRDDLTGGVISGNKIRKLEFVLAEAKRQKADVLITCGGIQSNHCRATAAIGARLGFKVHLVLRGAAPRFSEGNLLLDKLCGAEVSFYPKKIYAAKRAQIVEDLIAHYRKKGLCAYYFPVGASTPLGCWGYVMAFEEILAQTRRLKLKNVTIVSAVGSGGTTAGLLLGKALFRDQDIEVLGINVCDDAAYFEKEIRAILRGAVADYRLPLDPDEIKIQTIDGYVGLGYAIPSPKDLETIKRVARLEGVVFDPVYTGKAFRGVLSEVKRGRFGRNSNIVFIHTGGLFGLFAQYKMFQF
ncbi:MAG: D-cysteine desulfhydrase family protein [bacterium]